MAADSNKVLWMVTAHMAVTAGQPGEHRQHGSRQQQGPLDGDSSHGCDCRATGRTSDSMAAGGNKVLWMVTAHMAVTAGQPGEHRQHGGRQQQGPLDGDSSHGCDCRAIGRTSDSMAAGGNKVL